MLIIHKYKIMKLAGSLLLVLLTGIPCRPEVKSNFFKKNTVGFSAGYSQLQGYYNSKLYSSVYYDIYIIPYISKYIRCEADLAFCAYPLRSNKDSHIYSLSGNFGPLICFPIISMFEIYGGISFKANYLYISAAKTEEKESTFKPGLIVKTGVLLPLRWGIGLRTGAEYSQIWLSNKAFSTVNITAGITYNFNFSPDNRLQQDDINAESARIETLYTQAVNELNEEKYDKAKTDFNEVLSLKSEYKDAKKYIDIINETELAFSNATALIDKKMYYEAIPHLEKAGVYKKAARDELASIREKLNVQIPGLEKNGIKAYEVEDYKECMNIMERLLLIDPDNATAALYYQRAQKRYNALQKLR